MGKIYVGQIGVVFTFDTDATAQGIDLSAASTVEINYRKPDDITGSWTGTVNVDEVSYTTTTADDLDQAGPWYFQVHVVGTGYDALGESSKYVIYDVWG